MPNKKSISSLNVESVVNRLALFQAQADQISDCLGYSLKTMFWVDFSIADVFGPDAVQDTFNRAFAAWKHDVVYVTELVMVLNWKISQHYEQNMELAILYNNLWASADEWCRNNLKGKDLKYFYRTTD